MPPVFGAIPKTPNSPGPYAKAHPDRVKKFPFTVCNGHYNRTPDLGSVIRWQKMWDLASLIDTRHDSTRLLMSLVLLRTRTILVTSTRHEGTWLLLSYWTLTRPLGK